MAGPTAIGFLGFRKNQCMKFYSENAGIFGILSSGAARNQFLPVQSNTCCGCAENALKMLGFDVGAHPIPGILESIRIGAPR